MSLHDFKHIDGDVSHDHTLTLHDCIADRVCDSDGMLRFFLPDGIWITPHHKENPLGKTVRTDAAVVDFRAEDLKEITVQVFTRRRFRKTKVDFWAMKDLMDAINHKGWELEFIYQYRATFEQLWTCSLRSRKKPYYRKCQIHLPRTEATFYWNDLLPDREW